MENGSNVFTTAKMDTKGSESVWGNIISLSPAEIVNFKPEKMNKKRRWKTEILENNKANKKMTPSTFITFEFYKPILRLYSWAEKNPGSWKPNEGFYLLELSLEQDRTFQTFSKANVHHPLDAFLLQHALAKPSAAVNQLCRGLLKMHRFDSGVLEKGCIYGSVYRETKWV